jgi:hypothetical protein
LRETRRWMREQGLKHVNETAIFRAHERMSKIREQATSTTKAARRRTQRKSDAAKRIVPEASLKSAEAAHLEIPNVLPTVPVEPFQGSSVDWEEAKTRTIMTAPHEKRLAYVQTDRWIPYTRSEMILGKLKDLMTQPQRSRPPCLLLVGPSNNGKSHLLKRFARQHRPSDDPHEDNAHVPVLVVESPPGPDEGRLFSSILERISALSRKKLSPLEAEAKTIALLRGLRVRVLIIDEAHSAFSRHPGQHKYYLTVIKRLSNELGLPIVMAGVKEVLNVTRIDAQFANRFEAQYLPRWHGDHDYLRLLASFERLLPLRNASQLVEGTMATKLLALSEGLIGELSKLLERCAVLAIEQGTEQINFTVIQSVLERRLYVPPSDRNSESESLD